MMIFDYLENSYAKYPDKIAYADENKSMDYKTLHEHTYHIASVIAVALLIVLWVVPYLKSL
ncbi:MAG: hypothetical protein Q4E78_02645 [Eubacteriales bacterium]|nr:hypothetical protein [Eubacteriales bacterium]